MTVACLRCLFTTSLGSLADPKQLRRVSRGGRQHAGSHTPGRHQLVGTHLNEVRGGIDLDMRQEVKLLTFSNTGSKLCRKEKTDTKHGPAQPS